MLKISGNRRVDLHSLIGEIFLVHIRDYRGRKPSMGALIVNSEAMNLDDVQYDYHGSIVLHV